MNKKTFLLILIVFGLSSCGYTPMLSQNNNFNFNETRSNIENYLGASGDRGAGPILNKDSSNKFM